jgi:hypothetical protein
MLYFIKITGLSKALLLPLGATHDESTIETDGDRMKIHFGFVFDREMSLRDLKEAARHPWSLGIGIGVHANFQGKVAIIGSTEDIVRLVFSKPQPVSAAYGSACTELFLSVDEPDAFLEEVRQFIK